MVDMPFNQTKLNRLEACGCELFLSPVCALWLTHVWLVKPAVVSNLAYFKNTKD